jgi:hypothetical protein
MSSTLESSNTPAKVGRIVHNKPFNVCNILIGLDLLSIRSVPCGSGSGVQIKKPKLMHKKEKNEDTCKPCLEEVDFLDGNPPCRFQKKI